jgi:hypothetical protein
MKPLFTILFTSFLIVSCTKHDNAMILKDQNISEEKHNNSDHECPVDSVAMQTSEYKGITFYTENNLRGSGVITLSVTGKTDILNNDKTTYGSIALNNDEETSYEIKLPKKTVAREIIADSEFRIFSFDAEKPDTDKDFLIVYINREKKLIAKKGNQFTFDPWNKYAQSAFLKLTPEVSNMTKDEQLYWYKALAVKGDSMKIKSISKTDCDYVEHYKPVTKWIKWRTDSCKLINFNFCY